MGSNTQMNRLLRISLFIIIIILIQSMLFSVFNIFGAKIDLILIFVVLWAALRGPEEGLIIGFVFGLFQDFLSVNYYGNTLAKMILGFLVGVVKTKIYEIQYNLSGLFVFIFCFASFILNYFIFTYFLGLKIEFSLFHLILSAVLNSLISYLCFPLIAAVVGSKYD